MAQADVDKMSIWHFIKEYEITDGKDRLVLCIGDEIAQIAKYSLNSTRFNCDQGIIYTKDNSPRIILSGWIPLPSNLVGIQRMNIKPTPMLKVKFTTVDLKSDKRTDRYIAKSVKLVENAEHTMSRIVVHDRLCNELSIDPDDFTLIPNILRLTERRFDSKIGTRSQPLVVDLGEGVYPQAVWLIEDKNLTDKAATSTLIDKLSMTINNCEVYSVENIATKRRYDWEKGLSDKWIHYLGPINNNNKNKKQVSFLKFAENNDSNSGCICVNITKIRNRAGKYKLLVVYASQ